MPKNAAMTAKIVKVHLLQFKDFSLKPKPFHYFPSSRHEWIHRSFKYSAAGNENTNIRKFYTSKRVKIEIFFLEIERIILENWIHCGNFINFIYEYVLVFNVLLLKSKKHQFSKILCQCKSKKLFSQIERVVQ